MPLQHRMIRWLVLLLLPAVFLCCSAPNPAGPPAPPSELPAALSFPPDIRVDLTTVSGSSGASALVTAGGAFSDDITFGSRIVGIIDGQIGLSLARLSSLQIPISPTRTTFEGTIPVGDLTATVRIDFSDFDVNGDGASDGCTGCTCPLGCGSAVPSCPKEAKLSDLKPVCYRVWIKNPASPAGDTFTRFMAGRFDRLFIPDDPSTSADERQTGKGEFFVGLDPAVFPPEDGRNQTHAIYDQDSPADPLTKTSEIFSVLEQLDSGGTPVMDLREHATIDQTPVDATGDPSHVRKTVNFSLDNFVAPSPVFSPGDSSPPPPPTDVNYVARFREDLNFWSGTELLNPDPKGLSFDDACAFITSGNASPAANCTDTGIDVGGIPFVDFLNDAEVAFPSGFPLSPTF